MVHTPGHLFVRDKAPGEFKYVFLIILSCDGSNVDDLRIEFKDKLI